MIEGPLRRYGYILLLLLALVVCVRGLIESQSKESSNHRHLQFRLPTKQPSRRPTSLGGNPTPKPTSSPGGTTHPTKRPTPLGGNPTPKPTASPGGTPTKRPTKRPTPPAANAPTRRPSRRPSSPTKKPTKRPTPQVAVPTLRPTVRTVTPTIRPTSGSATSTIRPTKVPTKKPTMASTSGKTNNNTLPLPDGLPYNIGNPSGLIDIWVNPVSGNDAANGATRETALRTLSAAWNRIPRDTGLTSGYHIHITAGLLSESSQPNYWENRIGSYAAPIIIEGADPNRAARLASVNIYNTSYLYFINVQFDVTGGDQVHCELCTVFLLRDVGIKGIRGSTWEAVKVNQCMGVYIESCDIHGADDNAVDMVAVQYGHVIDSKIHDANWCMYHKGGSAYHIITRNEIYDCGESGYATGQGTGLEYMVMPWLRYESYDIKVENNLIYNCFGAGLGAYGGQNILFAYNTLFNVGKRSHTIEVVFGARSCDGENAICLAKNNAGGWGPVSSSLPSADIPPIRVDVVDNIIYNPPGNESRWQQLEVANPVAGQAGTNIPGSILRTDTELYIRGNIFWNGDASMPIGINFDLVCTSSNPTCTETLVTTQNAWNTINPGLTSYNSRPSASAIAGFTQLWSPIANFTQWDGTLGEPQGNLNNAVTTDFSGKSRSTNNAPGAYCSS